MSKADLTIEKQQIAKDGTVKFLFALADGKLIESVLMKHDYGNSICVTSQAGCNMGCAFCASGLLKKERDLLAEEMFAQVREVSGACGPITHIVVMGTGEPFDNFEEVLKFCDFVSDEKKMREEGLSMVAPRHITVSTCGLIPKIVHFSETKKRYNLAISLHAPDNEIRNRLMPVNKAYPIEELIRAAAQYCNKTKRRVTLEYILLDGVNDSTACAEELASLLEREGGCKENFYVNLIPYNRVSEFGFKGVSKETALAFYDVLMKQGIRATLRKERGTDISAACGQLRAQNYKRK